MSEKKNILLWLSTKKIDIKRYALILVAIGILAGGIVGVKKYIVDKDIKEHPAYHTYDSFVGKCKTLTPFCIANIIAVEGVRLNSDGLHRVYDDGNKQMTIGFGNTVLPNVGVVTQKTSPINNDDAYEAAKWHIESNETYFTLFCYAVAFDKIDNMTEQEIMAMTSIMYNSGSRLIENNNDKNCKNRFELLRQDFKNYEFNLPDSIVKQRFAQYPAIALTDFGQAWKDGKNVYELADLLGIYQKGGAGLRARRWIEAGLLTGEIMPQMLMQCPAGGIYDFYLLVGGTKNCLWDTNGEKIRVRHDVFEHFAKWLKNPINKDSLDIRQHTKKTIDFMPKKYANIVNTTECKINKHRVPYNIYWTQDSVGPDYNSQYAGAMWCYHNCMYKMAEIKLNNLIKEYPKKTALLKNNLSLIYLKTGRYDLVIENSRDILWNKNKNDVGQHAFAYNNAAQAYEYKSILCNDFNEQYYLLNKAAENYKLALKNGFKNAKKSLDRIQMVLPKTNNKTMW